MNEPSGAIAASKSLHTPENGASTGADQVVPSSFAITIIDAEALPRVK